MDLRLHGGERDLLLRILQQYLSDLRMEIADTDNPAFRRGLKEEREALESVAQRLADAASATTERDPEGRAVVRFVGVWVE